MSINPFDLLGVTIDSTPLEARSAFRELALMAHPDKGGRAEDMTVLLNAYAYVTKQLENVNRTKTVEDLDREFKAFCASQTEGVDLRPPWLKALLKEGGFDVDQYNAMFEKTARQRDDPDENERGGKLDDVIDLAAEERAKALNAFFRPVSLDDGYGSAMLASEYAVVGDDTTPINHAPPQYSPAVPDWTPLPPIESSKTDVASSSKTCQEIVAASTFAFGSSIGTTDYADAFNDDASLFDTYTRSKMQDDMIRPDLDPTTLMQQREDLQIPPSTMPLRFTFGDLLMNSS